MTELIARTRIALSLKPDFTEGRWEWSLAGEGFTLTGSVPARDREDAVLLALGASYDSLRDRGPVQLVVSLPASARLWAYAGDVAAHFAGVTLVPFKDTDTELRATAMKALNAQPLTAPAVPMQRVPDGPLTVATDGSASRGRIGWGWVTDDGRHDCGSATPTVKACTRRIQPAYAELRAISEAIAALPGRDLVIRSDCQPAVTLVRDWIAGVDRMPFGYDATHHDADRRGGLRWMQKQVRAEAHRIDIGWVRGHAGDPLNEAADSLAKLARRATEGTWGFAPADVPERARAIADAFVGHHQPAAAA